MSTKYEVPEIYYDEANQYSALVTLVGRTSTGNVTFTSTSSSISYNSTTGQDGILSQLETILTDYKVSAVDWNSITNDIANSVNYANIASKIYNYKNIGGSL